MRSRDLQRNVEIMVCDLAVWITGHLEIVLNWSEPRTNDQHNTIFQGLQMLFRLWETRNHAIIIRHWESAMDDQHLNKDDDILAKLLIQKLISAFKTHCSHHANRFAMNQNQSKYQYRMHAVRLCHAVHRRPTSKGYVAITATKQQHERNSNSDSANNNNDVRRDKLCLRPASSHAGVNLFSMRLISFARSVALNRSLLLTRLRHSV